MGRNYWSIDHVEPVDKNYRDPEFFLVTSRKIIIKAMAGQASSERTSVDDLIRDLSDKYGYLSQESPTRTKVQVMSPRLPPRRHAL